MVVAINHKGVSLIKSGSVIRSQSGVVLVFVLMFMLVLMIMAGSFSTTLRGQSKLSIHHKQLLLDGALVQAAMAYSQTMLTQTDMSSRWQSGDQVYPFEFDGKTMRIRVQDEAGKVDINHADRLLLQSVIASIGLETELNNHIVSQVLRKRGHSQSSNDLPEETDLEGSASRSSFKSLQDLQSIDGIDEMIFAKLEPMLTVHIRSERVDLSAAPSGVLAALPGSSPEWAEQVLRLRDESDGRLAMPSVPSEMSNYVDYKSARSGQYVSLIVVLPGQDQGSVSHKIVLRRNQQRVFPPFQELEHWTIAASTTK